jgi:hypothetical protein
MFDGEQGAKDITNMGGDAATTTMNRIELKHRITRKEQELRLRPISEETDWTAVESLPRRPL